MSDLKIALLGTPYVEHLGHQLVFRDRKTLALLAFLATEGNMQKRQKLARLFWPESDAAHGRTALRLTLLHLRHALEEDSLPGHQAHLIVTHDSLGFDTTPGIELDLHAIETAYSLTQKLPLAETMQGEARQTMIAHLQNAVALYRGDFLEDLTLRNTIDFDNWMGRQRQYWSNRIEWIFDQLSQLQSTQGAFEQAIATAERWRSLDPLNEEMYLRLMQLHLALGNRIAALKIYETCVDILLTELHARPSPKLLALAERIRNASTLHEHRSHMPDRQSESGSRPSLHVPFVGRGAEFSQLMAFYERASSGKPQVVMIEGEAGIGKSRLATTFLDWARVQGAEVLMGRAYKTHRRLSYQPLLDALRAWVEREPHLHQFLSTPWLAELSRLLPELRERYPDLPPPTIDDTFASARLLEALTRLGQACATQKPLLIFVDDIQWMDEATLDTLHYLFKHWTERATPALLLLVRRTETRSVEPWLAEGLAMLKSVAPLSRLELGPLSSQALLQIVRSFSQEEVQGERLPLSIEPFLQQNRVARSILSPERFSNWLFAETRGQPFYTVALLEALLERGSLVPRQIQGKGWIFEAQTSLLQPDRHGKLLPANVHEMIQSRMVRLSPAARELLAAGAVLDHDFSFEQLCQIAHLSTKDGLSALDKAMESLLLRESHKVSEKRRDTAYVFAHDKIREVVYIEAGEARRRIFHSRALELLERAGVSAAELAYHALASGATEAAFRWSVAAGDETSKVFAVRDAIGHYEQARLLIAECGIQAPAAILVHLFTQLGRAHEHRNNFNAAQTIYQTMLETARKLQVPVMECAALNHLAVLLSEDFSQLENVMALLQEALEAAERHHDQEGLAETQWSLARVYYYILNLETSLAHGKQAYALARELGRQDLVTKSLNVLAYTTRALGQWEEAAAIAEEARQLSAAQGDRMMEADSLSRIADAYINCGRPREGVEAARLAYTITLEIEHPWGQANSGYQLVRGLVETGAYEEALTIALQSTAVARTLTFNILLFVNLVTLGQAYQALLLPEKALQAHLEGLEVSKMVPSQRYMGLSFSLLCVDSALAGDWEAASSYAQQMLMIRDPQVVVSPEVPRWPETEALLRAGFAEQATEALRAFYERFGTNKRCHITFLRAQTVLAQARGEHEQARAYLQEAIAEADALGLPGELWQAEVALGRLHLTCKEHEQATQAFIRASVILEKLAREITSDELRSHFLARITSRETMLAATRALP